jgi:Flp pilus assembly pilin Flp
MVAGRRSAEMYIADQKVKAMMINLAVWYELLSDRRAITATEYGLIAAILAGVIFVGFQLMGNRLSAEFSNIGVSL